MKRRIRTGCQIRNQQDKQCQQQDGIQMNGMHEMTHIRYPLLSEKQFQQEGKERKQEHHIKRCPFGKSSNQTIGKRLTAQISHIIPVLFSPFINRCQSISQTVQTECQSHLQDIFFLTHPLLSLRPKLMEALNIFQIGFIDFHRMITTGIKQYPGHMDQ